MEGCLRETRHALQQHRRWMLLTAALVLVLILAIPKGSVHVPLSRTVSAHSGDPVSVPASQSNVHLSENGTVPTVVPAPRNDFALRGMVDARWMALHNQYVNEVALLQQGEGMELVFYGDSITEAWRGLQMGIRVDKFKGIPEVFDKHYGRLRATALSIAGDTTRFLLWRLQNGEGPRLLRPEVVVVLIGTNDLTNLDYNLDPDDAEGASALVAAGVAACVAEVLGATPTAHVVLVGLLPRADRRLLHFTQPARYTPAIIATNRRLAAWAATMPRVTFLDCGHLFLETDKQSADAFSFPKTGVAGGASGKGGAVAVYLNRALMPDALHPGPAGMDALAGCLRPALRKHLRRPQLLA